MAPLARPVSVTDAVLDRLDPMLLRASSTRLASLADVGIIAFSMVAFEFLGMTLLALASGIPISMLGNVDAQRLLLIPSFVVRFLSSIFCVLIVLRLRKQSRASVGLVGSKMGMNLLIGVGTMMVTYAITFPLMYALTTLSPTANEQMNQNVDMLITLLPKVPAWEFVWAMATVGVWEELIFRGFLMTRLRRATGGWIGGVLLSTGVFVAVHAPSQVPAAMVMIAVLSLIMSVVTIWRRSLVPAMVAHALFDLTQLVGLYFMAGDQWQ